MRRRRPGEPPVALGHRIHRRGINGFVSRVAIGRSWAPHCGQRHSHRRTRSCSSGRGRGRRRRARAVVLALAVDRHRGGHDESREVRRSATTRSRKPCGRKRVDPESSVRSRTSTARRRPPLRGGRPPRPPPVRVGALGSPTEPRTSSTPPPGAQAAVPVHLRLQAVDDHDLVAAINERSARCEPMNPAPPVTRIRTVVSLRESGGGCKSLVPGDVAGRNQAGSRRARSSFCSRARRRRGG